MKFDSQFFSVFSECFPMLGTADHVMEEKLEGELQEDLNGKTVDGAEGEEKIVLRAGAAAKSSKDFVIEDG
ncbi:MAG: hypothetical protein J6P89_08460, partial [Oscillospiraceae bacterium]|nr:hypothetical protein [Oscillospiraceae bacterium]